MLRAASRAGGLPALPERGAAPHRLRRFVPPVRRRDPAPRRDAAACLPVPVLRRRSACAPRPPPRPRRSADARRVFRLHAVERHPGRLLRSRPGGARHPVHHRPALSLSSLSRRTRPTRSAPRSARGAISTPISATATTTPRSPAKPEMNDDAYVPFTKPRAGRFVDPPTPHARGPSKGEIQMRKLILAAAMAAVAMPIACGAGRRAAARL